MNQRFTLDRESFEQFLAAVSLFQSLQQTAANRTSENNLPLLQYSLETLRAVDSGTLDLQAALERVAGLALQIVGGEGAIVWLFTSEKLICRAAIGTGLDDDHIRTALRSRLQSAGAFGINSPSTLDLTRTLSNYSGALGSSLAIALLPGGRIAGALAVFSDHSRTFTERNYANLRLLAGLAQYVLTKWAAAQDQDARDDSPEKYSDRNALLGMRASSSMGRSARAPFISRTPHPEPLPHEPIADLYIPGVGTRDALGVDPNDSRQVGPALQSLSTPVSRDGLDVHESSHNPADPPVRQTSPGRAQPSRPALQRWEEWKKRFKSWRDERDLTPAVKALVHIRRLKVTTWDAAENLLRRGRKVGVDWVLIRQAAPAFTILAVMSFFVGLLTGGRQPLVVGPLNPVAEAAAGPITHNSASNLNQKAEPIPHNSANSVNQKAEPVTHNSDISVSQKAEPVTPNSGSNVNQKAASILVPMKSTAGPIQTSHLQITDRETADTIAELSRYEVRTLRRAADYGDDQAALELGTLYELGRGFPQSCSKAAEWVTKAAQEGNPAAEYNLGLRYRDGDGVTANLQQAESWLRKAAAHKNSNAGRALADLSSQSPKASVSQITKSSESVLRTP